MAKTIVRRQKSLPLSKPPVVEWLPVERYPGLDENVRGARVFRTKDGPLRFRIVNQRWGDARVIAWPAVVAIANERRIRFRGTDDAPIEFGVILYDEEKVSEWRDQEDFPDFHEENVYISNPDFVLMTLDWKISRRRP
jgi:hypothetical protein